MHMPSDSGMLGHTRVLLRPSWLPAVGASFAKLDPRHMFRNPVMFVTEVGAAVTTMDVVRTARSGGDIRFALQVTIWLWLTVLFANFAEAVAEGRGKAQADALRRSRAKTVGRRLGRRGRVEEVPGESLRRDDIVIVCAGEVVPADGEVIEGSASLDESSITGESAVVIREAGGDHTAVTGGTKVLSDQIKVRISVDAGESFLDRMIALVEAAKRQKTPNEIALSILLSALTIIFLVVVMALKPIGYYFGVDFPITVLVALLVCVAPTTIGGLLSAIGIAGIDRMVKKNVLARSGRAVEAAGDVDVLLLDKTGTITQGNRRAVELFPAPGIDVRELAEAARLASLADETPEGRSIVTLVAQRLEADPPSDGKGDPVFVAFTAKTRMSGVDVDGKRIRKGAVDAIRGFLADGGGNFASELEQVVDRISRAGSTPLVVADDHRALGLIELKDIIKPGLPGDFRRLRMMGVRTVMITGDHRLTAAAIAHEVGVDDFLAEAKPEDKLALIRREQSEDHLVAMTGDGTNDAPALAQADVGLVMHSGTRAAEQAGNMVDLDSDPAKLIQIVEVGTELLITRGALTTFSITNDAAKYFAIIPAMLPSFPQIAPLNVMRLATPQSAILSAVIFNAVIIVALIPLALRGVRFRPVNASQLLRRNLLIFGLGGLAAPFAGIKLIDMLIHDVLHLV